MEIFVIDNSFFVCVCVFFFFFFFVLGVVQLSSRTN